MSVNIYERADIVEVKQILTEHMDTYDNTSTLDSIGGGWGTERIEQKGARPYKMATGSLLLLCALLLFTVIGLCVSVSRERDQLQVITANLTEARHLLQSTNASLTQERDALKTNNTILAKEREQLESSYRAVVRERDRLNASYTDTNAEKTQLQTNYDTLSKDKDQLQNSYNQLKQDQESLNTSYANLEKERDDMLKGLLDLDWRYFDSHLYYISTTNKSWDDARQHCKSTGADLVTINSQEEQEFVSSFNKEVWIGLSDVNVEGQWRWVDDSPLTTKFWAKDQPNSYKGEQDCVKLWLSPPLENWNDEKCSIVHQWICEKPIQR
ncbi:C-type lectin domain family 4 member F-like [Sardina pilchardus]|uniref:C-type lectin domain family 4 member F-like n=1 Tax=Sardina pilchardus TaxID=27697 RepID=UPI002E152909